MPLKGFKCKKGDVLFKDCLECGECVPRFLAKSIHNIQSHDYHKGDVITATSMLGCLRETYLQREYDYFSAVDSIFYSWRGTLAHTIFETADLDDWISEERYEKKLNGITITGQIDGYDKRLKRLYDIKTIKDGGMNFVIKHGAKNDHILQASIYKWLCPFTVKDAQICYISMSGYTLTGQPNTVSTWLKNKPKEGGKYNIIDVVETGKENYQKQREFLVTYDTPPLKLLSTKKIEEFMSAKALILNEAFTKGVTPPRCDEDTRRWKCDKYCSMKERCDEFEKKRKEVKYI